MRIRRTLSSTLCACAILLIPVQSATARTKIYCQFHWRDNAALNVGGTGALGYYWQGEVRTAEYNRLIQMGTVLARVSADRGSTCQLNHPENSSIDSTIRKDSHRLDIHGRIPNCSDFDATVTCSGTFERLPPGASQDNAAGTGGQSVTSGAAPAPAPSPHSPGVVPAAAPPPTAEDVTPASPPPPPTRKVTPAPPPSPPRPENVTPAVPPPPPSGVTPATPPPREPNNVTPAAPPPPSSGGDAKARPTPPSNTLAPGVSISAASRVDLANTARLLRSYALELRNTGQEMVRLAETAIPDGLSEGDRIRFATQRSNLLATGDAAQQLAIQVQRRAWKAKHGTLMQDDIDSLGAETDSLSLQLRIAQIPDSESESEPERLDRTGLNETIREVEAMQETVRNKRQMASASFQNFDQKANQLYELMSEIMKTMHEMQMATVRNTL